METWMRLRYERLRSRGVVGGDAVHEEAACAETFFPSSLHAPSQALSKHQRDTTSRISTPRTIPSVNTLHKINAYCAVSCVNFSPAKCSLARCPYCTSTTRCRVLRRPAYVGVQGMAKIHNEYREAVSSVNEMKFSRSPWTFCH